MSFVEVEFAFFLPLVWLAYWLLARSPTAQNVVLVAASYVFYASWHWLLLGLIVAGTVVDYRVARYLEQSADSSGRRWALTLSLGVSLGLLAFFKYSNFFTVEVNALLTQLGISSSLPVLKFVLPLGISYYTLQRVGYVLDVYWGRQRACQRPVDFAVFCSYFAQMTAGPIARGRELLPQLAARRSLQAQDLADGALAFLAGFAMQAWAGVAIGETLVNPVFADHALYSSKAHLIAVIGFAMQVFADFAGYSLMAIGVSRLFAIRLPINFNAPFLSKSLPEFWQRWHISLNRWLFDYIFTPLTTSAGWFRGRLAIALLITFLASGLWHGANWTFIIWGLLHGLGMVAHSGWDTVYKRFCRRDRRFVAWRKSSPYQLVAWFLTICFFVLTLVPFRSGDATQAGQFALAMLNSPGTLEIALSPSMLLAVCFLLGQHLLELEWLKGTKTRFFALPAPARGMAYGLAIAFLLISTPIGTGTFIYQQF